MRFGREADNVPNDSDKSAVSLAPNNLQSLCLHALFTGALFAAAAKADSTVKVAKFYRHTTAPRDTRTDYSEVIPVHNDELQLYLFHASATFQSVTPIGHSLQRIKENKEDGDIPFTTPWDAEAKQRFSRRLGVAAFNRLNTDVNQSLEPRKHHSLPVSQLRKDFAPDKPKFTKQQHDAVGAAKKGGNYYRKELERIEAFTANSIQKQKHFEFAMSEGHFAQDAVRSGISVLLYDVLTQAEDFEGESYIKVADVKEAIGLHSPKLLKETMKLDAAKRAKVMHLSLEERKDDDAPMTYLEQFCTTNSVALDYLHVLYEWERNCMIEKWWEGTKIVMPNVREGPAPKFNPIPHQVARLAISQKQANDQHRDAVVSGAKGTTHGGGARITKAPPRRQGNQYSNQKFDPKEQWTKEQRRQHWERKQRQNQAPGQVPAGVNTSTTTTPPAGAGRGRGSVLDRIGTGRGRGRGRGGRGG